MKSMGLSIDQVNVFDTNGISIFSRIIKKDQSEIDHMLLSAFFSAIRQFAQNMIRGAEIDGIKIGSMLLNFKLLSFDEGVELIFMMVSRGYSESMANDIADDISENFAINLDQYLQNRKMTLTQFLSNINTHAHDFSNYYGPLCEENVKQSILRDSVSVNFMLQIPTDLMFFLYNVILSKPSLIKLYERGTIDLLVETIKDFVLSDQFKEAVKKKAALD